MTCCFNSYFEIDFVPAKVLIERIIFKDETENIAWWAYWIVYFSKKSI